MRFLIITCLIFLATIRVAKSQDIVKVNAYRAIIHVESVNDIDTSTYSYATLDYDAYDSTKTKDFQSITIDREPNVEITKLNGVLTINGEQERELLYIRIRVPKNINLLFKVTHYGEVKAQDIYGDMNINVFSGKIDLKKMHGGVSVNSERNTQINVDQSKLTEVKGPIYLTTYSDLISLQLPESNEYDIQATTSTGNLTSSYALDIEKDLQNPFTVKTKSGSYTDYPKTGIYGKGGKIKIRVNSVLGDISIQQKNL